MLSGRGDSHFAPDAFVRDGRRVELRRRRHDLLTLLRERGQGGGGNASAGARRALDRWVKTRCCCGMSPAAGGCCRLWLS